MTTLTILAAACLGAAVLQSFLASRLPHPWNEVELAIPLWAAVWMFGYGAFQGWGELPRALESLSFTEPVFVWVILTVVATRPVLEAAEWGLNRLLRTESSAMQATMILTLGPLLGSWITEPAAMTVSALLLRRKIFTPQLSSWSQHALLAVLFVNVSIGGVLTPFAAPPVLLVAHRWGWDLPWMLTHFGWRAALAVVINAAVIGFLLRKPLRATVPHNRSLRIARPHLLDVGVHLLFLGGTVLFAHQLNALLGIMATFFIWFKMTQKRQDALRLKEASMVALFLAGVVILGAPQKSWIEPLFTGISHLELYFGATLLTAVTDNAALTYIGSQLQDLSPDLRYALVSGAVAGGGLTLIANAPNPAGYAMLKSAWNRKGFSPFKLLLLALPPTIVALLCFLGGLGIPEADAAERCYSSPAEIQGDPRISDVELLGRLLFAEGMSSRAQEIPTCQDSWRQIVSSIGWGVRSRVLAGYTGKTLRAVIFAPHQFRPAISMRSRYSSYFLCPTKFPQWGEFRDIARSVLGQAASMSPFLQDSHASAEEKRTGISRVNQFYYPFSLQATTQPPLWTRHPGTRVTGLRVDGREIPDACIWFFRN